MSETEGYWSPRLFLLQSPCMELLILTYSKLQNWGSSFSFWCGTELSSFMMRTGGAAFSQTIAGRRHCSFAEHFSLHYRLQIWVSINLSNNVCPALVIL